VFAEMTRDRARHLIEAPADAGTDQERERLAPIEVGIVSLRDSRRKGQHSANESNSKRVHSPLTLHQNQ
jgi:hypothetical protein